MTKQQLKRYDSLLTRAASKTGVKLRIAEEKEMNELGRLSIAAKTPCWELSGPVVQLPE